MLQISQYDFSDNPNIPRILDSAKRDYNIDLHLDFVIEQIADCIRLITANEAQCDKNGFPFISNEKIYYACLHWIIYKLLLKRFFIGIEDGSRLQFFKDLSDKYINQARVNITSSDMQKIIDIQYSVYNRNGNNTEHGK